MDADRCVKNRAMRDRATTCKSYDEKNAVLGIWMFSLIIHGVRHVDVRNEWFSSCRPTSWKTLAIGAVCERPNPWHTLLPMFSMN